MAKEKETNQERSDADRAKGADATETVVAGVSAAHVKDATKPGASQPLVPPSGAPGAHMVLVKEKASGKVTAHWAVDARELVTHPNQEHEYATEEEAKTFRAPAANLTANPTPVAPNSSNSPIGVDPVVSPTPPAARAGGPLLVAVPVEAARAAGFSAGTGSNSPIDPLTATSQLQDMSKAELQEIARRSNVDPNQSKDKLVEAILPHVEAGTVSLSQPTPLNPQPQQGGRAGG